MQIKFYIIQYTKSDDSSGIVKLSVPFGETASNTVTIKAINIDFINHKLIPRYANAPDTIIKEIINIVADPAILLVEPNILNSLLLKNLKHLQMFLYLFEF